MKRKSSKIKKYNYSNANKNKINNIKKDFISKTRNIFDINFYNKSFKYFDILDNSKKQELIINYMKKMIKKKRYNVKY